MHNERGTYDIYETGLNYAHSKARKGQKIYYKSKANNSSQFRSLTLNRCSCQD